MEGSCLGAGALKGASASKVMIHGDMVVMNDLPVQRPQRVVLEKFNIPC